jgi:flagellar basal-body rod protein FlgB
MFFFDVANSGPIPAMEKMLAYTEGRHRMLTENIANIDTPGYHARQLDFRAFQGALREAIDRRGSGGPLKIQGNQEFGDDSCGQLAVNPTEEPSENILFHDQTNMRVEREMSTLAENTMMHQIVVSQLKDRFDGLMAAIRGKA